MKLGRWSTTAASNNTTPPDGWPEGQAPSTVNDCAREMMASIRTVFNDAQYFDQDFTPTYVAATQFSVTGNQTSAIHAGRRLKIYDATAGVATVIYATVVTASFTAITNIHISADDGQLTSSLSSFAIAVLSNTNNSLPRNPPGNFGFDKLSASAAEITGALTVSGAVVLKGALSVGGAASFADTISASAVAAKNTAKAWCRFSGSAAAALLNAHNVASTSRSASGSYRITFSVALADGDYAFLITPYMGDGTLRAVEHVTMAAGSFKFRTRNTAGSAVDTDIICAAFYR